MVKELIKKFVPDFILSWYHFGLAFLGAVLYGFPSRKLVVIGVTGTKGKSTVVEFCHQILSEAGDSAKGGSASGGKVASLSSIRFKINNKEWPNTLKMTMPGRFKIQKFLRQAKNAGCKYLILEVTSEGILQHRHQFINFNTSVFTNLAPEHIERHGSFEKYREAKGKLFQITKKVHILNLDDENANYFLQFSAEKKYGYTMNSEQKTANNKKLFIVYCSLFFSGQNGINFGIQDIKFNLKLLGEFNIYNALAAICVGLSQGVNLETCKKALEKIERLPGRMEIIVKEPFKVIVDYAHTPDALEKVYETSLKLGAQNSKLICVLGSAGGGRDKWKRPKMGEIAAKYCDNIILTNEDPYDEDPNQILSEIKSGISNFSRLASGSSTPISSKVSRFHHGSATESGLDKVGTKSGQFLISNLRETLDRKEAVKEALSVASPGDVVIITGKGCEPWMCVAKGKKIPWDDRQVVREEFLKP